MVSSMSKKVIESVDFSSKSPPCPWEKGGGNHRSVCPSVSRYCLLIRPCVESWSHERYCSSIMGVML